MADEGRGSQGTASESGPVDSQGQDAVLRRSEEGRKCRERLRAVNSSASGQLTWLTAPFRWSFGVSRARVSPSLLAAFVPAGVSLD